jgi:hypothetical protein
VDTVAVVVASLSTFAAGREGKAACEHERRLARDARLFERRADAYEAMMKYCEMHMQTVESRCPVIGPGPEAANFPKDPEEKMSLRGSFSTYASPEAYEALESFLNQTLAFYIRADLFENLNEQGLPAGDALKEMNKAREEVRTRFGELQAQIRGELAAA